MAERANSKLTRDKVFIVKTGGWCWARHPLEDRLQGKGQTRRRSLMSQRKFIQSAKSMLMFTTTLNREMVEGRKLVEYLVLAGLTRCEIQTSLE